MYMTQLAEQLPRVGERRMEVMTYSGAYPGERTARPCTVVQVHPEHLWYRVQFDANGCSECYKIPNTPEG